MSGGVNLLIIGHRGASYDYPENTAASFRGAREQGADWVELDVRSTADGSLIVHHDAWYRDGRTVWSTPINAVPDGVPDLATALDACAGMGINVEIKNSPGDLGGDDVPYRTEVADDVLRLIGERSMSGIVEEVLISSFDIPTLDRVLAVDPSTPTGYLIADLDRRPAAPEGAAASGHRAFHPWDHFVDAPLIERCHELGLRVNTWTVDDPDRMRALARWGVDGIVTNVPAVASRTLDR